MKADDLQEMINGDMPPHFPIKLHLLKNLKTEEK